LVHKKGTTSRADDRRCLHYVAKKTRVCVSGALAQLEKTEL